MGRDAHNHHHHRHAALDEEHGLVRTKSIGSKRWLKVILALGGIISVVCVVVVLVLNNQSKTPDEESERSGGVSNGDSMGPTPTRSPVSNPVALPETTPQPSPQPTDVPTKRPVESTQRPTKAPVMAPPTTPPTYAENCPSRAKPNIVLFFADDQGYGDREKYNPSIVKTPWTEKVAAEGTDFLDGHSYSTTCSPSRFTILSGEYHSRSHPKQAPVGGDTEPELRKLVKDETGTSVTLGSVLRSVGYKTFMLGKYHLGMDIIDYKDYSKGVRGTPFDFGFDHFYGTTNNDNWLSFIEDDHWPAIPDHYTGRIDNSIISCPSGNRDCKSYGFMNCEKNAGKSDAQCQGGVVYRKQPKKGWKREISDTYIPHHYLEDVTNRALRYLDDHHAEQSGKANPAPFFMHINWLLPHVPHTPHPDFQGRTSYGAYADVLEEMDYRIGQILMKIEDQGKTGDTLVIITSDNGAENIGRYQKTGHFPSHHFHGEKRSLYEGGHRVPFIVRWPGVVPAGKTSDLTISQADLLRTFADITGAQVPPGAAQDSFSFYKALCDPTGTKQHEIRDNQPFIHTQPLHRAAKKRDGRMIRCGDMKTFWNEKGDRVLINITKTPKEEDGRDGTKDRGDNIMNNKNKAFADELWAIKEEIYKNGHSAKTRCDTLTQKVY